ncbi:hypothetical protein CF319_g7012 [Tilletia indica]|nr:hypothetical protein CF319_g7012 [Tilletia indica]
MTVPQENNDNFTATHTDLTSLALTLAANPLPSFALPNTPTHTACLLSLQHIFTHAIHSEQHAAPHIIPFLHSIHPEGPIASRKRKRSGTPHSHPKVIPTKHSLFTPTPIDSLVIDGMDPDQLWEQLELRTAPIHKMISALIVTESLGEDEQDAEDGSAGWTTEDEDDEEDDDEHSEESDEHELEPDGHLELVDPADDYEDDDDSSDESSSEEKPKRTIRVRFHEQVAFRPIPPRKVRDSDSEDDSSDDEDEDEDEDERDMRQALTLTPAQIQALAEGSLTADDLQGLYEGNARRKGLKGLQEEDGDEDEDEDEDEDDEDDEDDQENDNPSSTKKSAQKYNKHGFAEFDDASEEEVDDQDDDNDGDQLDEEADGDLGIDLFQDFSSNTTGNNDAADAFFSDFFEKPKGGPKRVQGEKKKPQQPAKKRARLELELEQEELEGFGEEDDDLDEDEEEQEVGFDDEATAKRVSNDLFAEEKEEGPQAKSRFEQRQAALRTEIAALERENVSKKDWTLRGEISAPSRPLNSLLEEDLDFEQSKKRAPIITEASTLTLEERIKGRILEGRWDDVQKRFAGVERGEFLPSRMLELSDAKSGRSLAELYEEDYQAAGSSGATAVGSAADRKLAAEHEAIAGLFEEVCGKLDALSNAHYTPKAPKATIQTLTNAPAITLESALPSTAPSASRTMLAPEELFQPASGSSTSALIGSKSEMTPEERQGLYERLRREKKSRNEKMERGRVERERVRGGGEGATKGGKKGEKEAKEAALRKLIGNKGVSVIGKDGKNRTGKDALGNGKGKGKGASQQGGSSADAGTAKSGSKLKL